MKPELNKKRMPANRFTWEKYGGQRAFCVNDAFMVEARGDAGNRVLVTKPQPDVTVIGFCDANTLVVRPRKTGFAVMFERDGEDFWFHSEDIDELFN